MKNHSNSRIYVIDSVTNKKKYFTLLSNGKDFFGHTGGIQYLNGFLYLADEGTGLYKFSVENIDKISGSKIDIGSPIKLNTNTSFVFGKDEYLYVGEFHDGNDYVTEHPYETPDGLYHAIISRYSLSDLTKPDRIYSVRDKVQGILFAEGKIVLSTSYGLADSVYYIYNEADCIKSEHTLDGAPVYYVNNLEEEFTGPAMAEGLDLYNGKVITMSESASNKYIFGKFFFANKIITLDILK
jgi:hypothetical protein